MALFRKVQRKPQTRQREDRAVAALDLMMDLQGRWAGPQSSFDPDERKSGAQLLELRKFLCMDFDICPEGTHLIAHSKVRGETPLARHFDVWGQDERTRELVRTTFAHGNRQTNIYDVSSLEANRSRRCWSIVLDTVSWDEGRPCEFRYELCRNGSQVKLKLDRRLINQATDYEPVNRASLIRKS